MEVFLPLEVFSLNIFHVVILSKGEETEEARISSFSSRLRHFSGCLNKRKQAVNLTKHLRISNKQSLLAAALSQITNSECASLIIFTWKLFGWSWGSPAASHRVPRCRPGWFWRVSPAVSSVMWAAFCWFLCDPKNKTTQKQTGGAPAEQPAFRRVHGPLRQTAILRVSDPSLSRETVIMWETQVRTLQKIKETSLWEEKCQIYKNTNKKVGLSEEKNRNKYLDGEKSKKPNRENKIRI